MPILAFFKSLFGRQTDSPPPPDEVEDPEPTVAPAPSEAPPPPAKPQIDFVAIFEAAGVHAEERARVVKAQELLRTLPEDAPVEVKRHIVEAAFKAFDIPTSKIVETATREIDALHAFIDQGEEEMKRIRAECVRQIAELEAKIAQAKASMARSLTEQEDRAEVVSEEILRIQPVVSFFLRDEEDEEPEDESVEIQVDPGPPGE